MKAFLRSRLMLLAALTTAPVLTAAVVMAAPPGQSPLAEVEQAYDSLKTYQSEVEVSIEQQRGRWNLVQRGVVRVAFDRESGQLRVDHPSYEVVASDKLRMKTDQLPGTYLEVDGPQPLDYAALERHMQPLLEPALPDVALLLAERPQQVLGEGAEEPVVPRDAEGGRRYEFATATGTYTLTVDPQTKLLTRAVHEMDAARLGAPAGDSARVVFTFNNVTANEALADDAFAFDTTGSAAVDSLQAMMTGGPGGGGGAAGGGSPLVGQDAPAIELAMADGEDFKLSENEARVVVLDFWATWCPPCRESLPLMQGLHEWAEKEHGDAVAVYAVNMGETVEQVQAYWQQNGLDMPVLMDTEMAVGAAYGAEAIPHTVVIADGKVRHVLSGFRPGMDDDLKQQIAGLLAEPTPAVD